MMPKIQRDPNALMFEVRERLLEAIASGTLVPGDRLLLDRLAEQLGVSRTPVRDALLRLVSEGIVEPADRRGYIIRELTEVEVANNYDSRLAIETHAAARLAELGDAAIGRVEKVLTEVARQPKENASAFFEANRLVHRAIVGATGNPQLLGFFDTVWSQAISNRIYITFYQAEADDTFVEDHQRLIDAIAVGDPAAARSAMYEHVCAGRSKLTTQWQLDR
jgi:DNA-binding GntR family transcriptional regulator